MIPDHKRIYDLFMNVEMPIVEVAAEMELAGIEIDTEYAKLLSAKYHKQLDLIDKQIEEEVKKYNVGNKLPVAIILDDDNNELERIIGEKKKEEVISVINKFSR